VTNGAITKEAGDFLTRHIDSVAHLELLLLLYGDKDREWSADGIARELRVERGWAVARLKEFAASGIARESAPQTYRYAPRNDKLHAAVQAVTNAYAERRVAVIDFIYAKPLANLRVFAESFRIRRKDSNGKDGNDG
jgi:hypothetical protein